MSHPGGSLWAGAGLGSPPLSLLLPLSTGGIGRHVLRGRPPPRPPPEPAFDRVVFAAAHVVADPLMDHDPWGEPAVDWEATLDYRHRLWSLGFGVAEAIGPAQRGVGLDFETAGSLIRRTLEEARTVSGARVAAGCGTDQLEPAGETSLDDVIAAYESQLAVVEGLGGQPILLPSQALARVARSAADYERVYDRLLGQVRRPVILKWTGEALDPALAGYWGTTDFERAMEVVIGIVEAHASRIDGLQVALLDKPREIRIRRRLPPGLRLYTGDELDYVELIEGDDYGTSPNRGQSDAVLGIFDAIAPLASAALAALAIGNVERYRRLLEPTVALSRQVFRAPTRHYRTGIVFLAWLNGHQAHFTMLEGRQSARSLAHLAELFRLADAADLIEDPELAVHRMRFLLALHGVEQA